MGKLCALRKILFSLLMLVALTLLISPVLPWEFINEDLRDRFILALVFSVPLIVLGLTAIDYLRYRKTRIIYVSVILGGFLSFVGLAIFGFLALFNFNSREKDTKVLSHRFKQGLYVVSRKNYLNDQVKIYKVKRITPWHQYTISVDSNEINWDLWVKKPPVY